MSEFLTTPETLPALAHEHRGNADALTALAGTERGGIAGLGPTFGLIGAEFLAALAEVLDIRQRRLAGLSGAHANLAGTAIAATGQYAGADDDGAGVLNAGLPR